jgi:hypothetical protein
MCECGIETNKYGLSQHKKTKKHLILFRKYK